VPQTPQTHSVPSYQASQHAGLVNSNLNQQQIHQSQFSSNALNSAKQVTGHSPYQQNQQNLQQNIPANSHPIQYHQNPSFTHNHQPTPTPFSPQVPQQPPQNQNYSPQQHHLFEGEVSGNGIGEKMKKMVSGQMYSDVLKAGLGNADYGELLSELISRNTKTLLHVKNHLQVMQSTLVAIKEILLLIEKGNMTNSTGILMINKLVFHGNLRSKTF